MQGFLEGSGHMSDEVREDASGLLRLLSYPVAEKEENAPSHDEEDKDAIRLPSHLPILPLRGVVVFPMTAMPLRVGQPRSIRLIDDAGVIVDRVVYDDVPPWPAEADGDGPSMELVHPILDNSQAQAWCAATVDHGSPGAQNTCYSVAPIVAATRLKSFGTEPPFSLSNSAIGRSGNSFRIRIFSTTWANSISPDGSTSKTFQAFVDSLCAFVDWEVPLIVTRTSAEWTTA